MYVVMSKSLSKGGFKRLDLAKFNLTKYDDNSSISCVLEVDIEHPKDLLKFCNDYLLAPDRLEREMLLNYQLNNADNYNISIASVKK